LRELSRLLLAYILSSYFYSLARTAPNLILNQTCFLGFTAQFWFELSVRPLK
jgi:hypothetical protein